MAPSRFMVAGQGSSKQIPVQWNASRTDARRPLETKELKSKHDQGKELRELVNG